MITRPFIIMMMFLSLFFQNCGGNVSFKSDELATSSLGTDQVSSVPESSEESNIEAPEIEAPLENIIADTNTDEVPLQEMPPLVMVPETTPPTTETDPMPPMNPAPPVVVETPPAPPTMPDAETPPPTPAPPVNVDNNNQLETPVSFAECTSFVELDKNQLIELPDRAASSICYYVKLINRIQSHASGSQGEIRATDVLASNHDGDHSSYIAPYILGDAQVQARNLRHWKLALSGSPNNPTTQMRIDNFYLVQILFGNSPSFELISAFGTADAAPGSGEKPILLNDQPIALRSYAPGGTATVEALNITPPSELSASYMGIYNLRLRALDCGGSADGRDVYLVFH